MDRDQKAQKPGNREVSTVATGTAVVTLFLAAMLQWAAVLAVCPSVHELVHHDADDETIARSRCSSPDSSSKR